MNDLRRATRADVARLAQVSETVVSYVLNENRYVRQDKRERVLKAVEELNYQPNPVARTLKGKRSDHIAFIADQIDNEHFGKIIEEMDRQAYDSGLIISLCATRNDDRFVAQMLGRRFDGIVISSISLSEQHIAQFVQAGLPVVVLMNRDYDALPSQAGRIYTGLYEGARACVRHLHQECGRSRILYIDRFSAHGNYSSMQDLRYRGFVHQMRESGLPLSESNIITGCRSEEEVVETIVQRIQSGFCADALFGRNDRLAALGALALRELKKEIPKDVSLIGFDNSTLSRYVTPPLTTMEIDRPLIAQAAIQMLQELIEGRKVLDRHFETRLIRRGSTI